MDLDLVELLLLVVLVWQMERLNRQAKEVNTELITARWEGNQRLRRLETKVELQGQAESEG